MNASNGVTRRQPSHRYVCSPRAQDQVYDLVHALSILHLRENRWSSLPVTNCQSALCEDEPLRANPGASPNFPGVPIHDV